MQRHLPTRVANLCAEMVTVDTLEFATGDKANPEVEGDLRIHQVFGEAACDLQVGLLEHVGGIDPALEAAVEAKLNHPTQAGAEVRKGLRKRRRIPLGSSTKCFRTGFVTGGHD